MNNAYLKLQIVLLAGILVGGCSNPADNVPAAQVGSPTNETAVATPAAAAAAKSFVFGPTSSKIEWVGSKVTGSHDGGFTNFVGEIRVADGKLVPDGTRVVIETASLWSDNNRLTGHLKNPDFFDVQKYPTAIFQSTGFSEQGGTNLVTGNLTMHGVTKQISFPATVQVSDDKVSIKAEFAINRFDFEMKYAGQADNLIRKEVVLKLDVSAAPGTADFTRVEKPSAG